MKHTYGVLIMALFAPFIQVKADPVVVYQLSEKGKMEQYYEYNVDYENNIEYGPTIYKFGYSRNRYVVFNLDTWEYAMIKIVKYGKKKTFSDYRPDRTKLAQRVKIGDLDSGDKKETIALSFYGFGHSVKDAWNSTADSHAEMQTLVGQAKQQRFKDPSGVLENYAFPSVFKGSSAAEEIKDRISDEDGVKDKDSYRGVSNRKSSMKLDKKLTQNILKDQGNSATIASGIIAVKDYLRSKGFTEE